MAVVPTECPICGSQKLTRHAITMPFVWSDPKQQNVARYRCDQDHIFVVELDAPESSGANETSLPDKQNQSD